MITVSLLALLYFLPTIVGSHRGHHITGVLLLNFLFGWTGIGWFALLLWALLSTPRTSSSPTHRITDILPGAGRSR